VTSLLGINAVDHPGGAEVGLLRLSDRLRDRGWDITLTSPGAQGPLARAGFPHHKLDVGGLGTGEGARAVAAWPRALLLAREHDVVYLNSTVCGRLLPALRGAFKTVLHVHDIVDRVPRHWHRADVVLADSEAVADRLDGLDPHVVYCPVDLDPPHVPPPWPESVTDGGPVIGFIGRIERRKGVLDLVRAAPQIRAARPDATIVVIGDDPYETDAEYLAEVKRAEGVLHLPWVDDAGGVMRHLDVLVAPSHQEPFGTVLGEAMAVGTPVVATRVGGLTEVVDDGVTGVLVDAGAPDQIADAVLHVLRNRDAMSAAAVRAARRFGADDYAARVERLIR
jgi:glycosyltransferase involved in cell wall biosynthesis